MSEYDIGINYNKNIQFNNKLIKSVRGTSPLTTQQPIKLGAKA